MKTTYILVDGSTTVVMAVAQCKSWRAAVEKLKPLPWQKIFVEVRTTDKSE